MDHDFDAQRSTGRSWIPQQSLKDKSTLEVNIGPIDLSFDLIWEHELVTTKIAIECGFLPDGWGFFIPSPKDRD